MNQRYRWRCFACDKANAASATVCASCGFPARASGTEIARARASRRIDGSFERPFSPPTQAARVPRPRWSSWRKGSAMAGVAMVAIGGLATLASWSWPLFALSLLAFMLGALLLLVACVPRTEARLEVAG
ncbi:MAG TPA: hypothetical protein VEB23_11765 [Ramlibacter sp.]|nr:hypothetical protein [Ramlibacter sp.]